MKFLVLIQILANEALSEFHANLVATMGSSARKKREKKKDFQVSGDGS